MPLLLVLLLALTLEFCVARRFFKLGEEESFNRNWDSAVEYYLKALQRNPQDVRYRISLGNAMLAASNYHYEQAEQFYLDGDYKRAAYEAGRAVEYNSDHDRARKLKLKIQQEIDAQAAKDGVEVRKPVIVDKSESAEELFWKRDLQPIDFKLSREFDLKEVFKSLQKITGVEFVLDESFQNRKVTVDASGSLRQILDRICLQNRLFYKVLDERTVVIAADNQAKRRQYQNIVMKTFFLQNADCNQLQTLVRTLTEVKVTGVDPALNTLTVRDTPEKVEMAEKIIAIHDKPKPEILIDVEILEVNRSRMRDYGIELSNYQITQSLAMGSKSESVLRGHMIRFLSSSDFLFTIPSITYKLLQSDTSSKIIARPQLRVLDKETVKVRLGDRVPMPVTTFVPYASGGVNQQPITSFQMQDVGINIELTPKINNRGLIELKLTFELTFITNPGSATIPPTIGNRSVNTVISLRDNETGLLAGLIRDTERGSVRSLPAIASLPLLKSLFGSNAREITQTDIILTLTPRVVKLPALVEDDLRAYDVGTEEEIGIKLNRKAKKEEAEKAKPAKKDDENVSENQQLRPRLVVASEGNLFRKAEQFPVRIMLSDPGNIKSLFFEIAFDRQVLQVIELQGGSKLEGSGDDLVLKSYNNGLGIIQGSVDIGSSHQGELELLAAKLLAVNPGRSSFLLKKIKVLDKKGELIDVDFIGLDLEVRD